VTSNQVSDRTDPGVFSELVDKARLGLPSGQRPAPGPEALKALRSYCTLMLQWNKAINVTGADSTKALVLEHLPDSLALAEVIPSNARVIDVGSGGGLPAIALKILRPDLVLTMVEPRAKRVSFLRTALRDAGIAATIIPDRLAETPQPELLGKFDAAISRATFAPARWIELGLTLVRPQGLVMALISDNDTVNDVAGEPWPYKLTDGRERVLRIVQRST